MAKLEFSIKLKEKEVTITDGAGTGKKYKIKELTSDQREKYNENFNYTMEVVDDKIKAKIGKDFKMPTAKDLLTLCLYDEDNNLVKAEAIGKYPNTMQQGLVKAALELSGMDAASLQKAKNELEANEDNGSA